MSIVVSFHGFSPVARYDSVPWTQIEIEETSDPLLGSWAVIDTLTISPVDADPSLPATQSFTTENGTAINQWYRITFLDAQGGQTEPTEPQQNVPLIGTPYATVDELAQILKVDPVKRREPLVRVLAAAAFEIDSYVGNLTPYANPPALAVEVNLERAVEHWQQMQSPFGLIGLGGMETAVFASSDSWRRHAAKLAPLRFSYGIA